MIEKFSKLRKIKIREFAKFIGSIVACWPAITYSWLYTKAFERQKCLAFNANNPIEKLDLKNDLKNDVKKDVKNGVKNDVKNDIKNDVKNYVKNEVKNWDSFLRDFWRRFWRTFLFLRSKPKARFILLNGEFDSSYSVSGCSLRDFQSASELSLDLMYDANIQILRVSHQMPNISSYFV